MDSPRESVFARPLGSQLVLTEQLFKQGERGTNKHQCAAVMLQLLLDQWIS